MAKFEIYNGDHAAPFSRNDDLPVNQLIPLNLAKADQVTFTASKITASYFFPDDDFTGTHNTWTYTGDFTFERDASGEVTAISGAVTNFWMNSTYDDFEESFSLGGYAITKCLVLVEEFQTLSQQELMSRIFAGDDHVIGTFLNDRLFGFRNADILSGEGGKDILDGGTGDDILIGGPQGDKLIGGEGDDAASYANAKSGVTASLETPSVNTGDAKSDKYFSISGLIGSGFRDSLIGNGEDNRIAGGKGNDKLTGGGGADTFVFDTKLSAKSNVDEIADFKIGVDHIGLSYELFGFVFADEFKDLGKHGAKVGQDDRILYNSKTGDLYFDHDGKGGDAAIKFAHLDNHPAVTFSDLLAI